MGCCSSNTESLMFKPDGYITDLILQKFPKDQVKLLSCFDKTQPDKLIIEYKEKKYNALGLSILASDLTLMKSLHRNFAASFSVLDEILYRQNKQLIQIIIKNFNPDITEYYLPIYLEYKCKYKTFDQDYSLSFTSFSLNTHKIVHPMRYAAKHGCLNFLKFIVQQFKFCYPPDSFNLHSIDEEPGENCALVACRYGNLPVVEFLHKMNCDFKLINKNNENAINLALVPKFTKSGRTHKKVSVLPYLVEVIGLDITQNHEETLMLCKSSAITDYIEEKLRQKGVFVSKTAVEAKYQQIAEQMNDLESPIKFTSFERILDANKEISLTFS